MPPYSCENGTPNMPSSPIFRSTSGSCSPVRSTSLARGRSSSSQNSRIIRRRAMCSGENVKSIRILSVETRPAAPLRLYLQSLLVENPARDGVALNFVRAAKEPQGFDLHRAVGDVVLDGLLLGDGRAELLALGGEIDSERERALGGPQRRGGG